MIDANTIIGEPVTTADGITLIPVSKVSFGLIGGGSDFPKKTDPTNAFGGGIGAGVKIEPVAFLVAKDADVKMLHVSPAAASTIDKIIDTVPEVINKITDFFGHDKEEEPDED